MAAVRGRVTEKVCHLSATKRRGALEGVEEAEAGPLVGRFFEQIFTVKRHRAGGDFILRMTHDHEAERALAGAVWSHQRVRLAAFDHEVHAAEDRLTFDAGVEVFD